MKVLITGATGLLGNVLVKQLLSEGYAIHYLTTSKEKIEHKENYKGFYWNPEKEEMDENALEGVSVIIHLAGTSISKRWTTKNKASILNSRIVPIQMFYKILATQKYKVQHFITASAVGIYPHSYNNVYEEIEKEIDASFLGEVVEKWESEAGKLAVLGVIVSKIRIGLVLSNNGGAFPLLVKPVKMNLGALFGSGKQFQSWIHIEDLAAIFVLVVKEKLQGTFNAVAPNPITHKIFMEKVAKKVKKKIWLPAIPRFFMELVLGEKAYLLFSSQQVSSNKIEQNGYAFRFPTLDKALEDLL